MTSTTVSGLRKCESAAEIIQGTAEWLKWRDQGLGGSELAAVMGESEYDTAYSLWRVRTGRDPKKETNFAMTVGLENEAKARAMYELETGVDCPPQLFQHRDLAWARCSLDGWIEDRQIPVEFKCMGKEKHALAVAGKIPATYVAQVQWQMFVTGAKVVHFVSLNPEGMMDIAIVPVPRDLEYWAKMIPAAEAFWNCIQTDTPPPLCDRDFKELDDEPSKAVFERWKNSKLVSMQLEEMLEKLKGEAKQNKEALEAARAEIEVLVKSEHPKLRCNGVKVFTVKRKSGSTLDIRLDESDSTPDTARG